jgi:hypothetical protein
MPYADGTCRKCGRVPRENRTTCEPCGIERARIEAEQRAARRQAGVCLFGGCGAAVAPTKLAGGARRKRVKKAAKYCKKHLEYYSDRQRSEG